MKKNIVLLPEIENKMNMVDLADADNVRQLLLNLCLYKESQIYCKENRTPIASFFKPKEESLSAIMANSDDITKLLTQLKKELNSAGAAEKKSFMRHLGITPRELKAVARMQGNQTIIIVDPTFSSNRVTSYGFAGCETKPAKLDDVVDRVVEYCCEKISNTLAVLSEQKAKSENRALGLVN